MDLGFLFNKLMSREELKTFIYAIEHNLSIRMELADCKDKNSIIKLARKYHFNVNENDLVEKEYGIDIEQWFENSIINPIKRK